MLIFGGVFRSVHILFEPQSEPFWLSNIRGASIQVDAI